MADVCAYGVAHPEMVAAGTGRAAGRPADSHWRDVPDNPLQKERN
jgi:hypothetical protein